MLLTLILVCLLLQAPLILSTRQVNLQNKLLCSPSRGSFSSLLVISLYRSQLIQGFCPSCLREEGGILSVKSVPYQWKRQQCVNNTFPQLVCCHNGTCPIVSMVNLLVILFHNWCTATMEHALLSLCLGNFTFITDVLISSTFQKRNKNMS